MATAELTFDELRAAIVRLPPAQRRQLLDSVPRLPTPEEAIETLARIRGKYRLEPQRKRRLSELLDKGNEGELTTAEARELNELVDEVEQNLVKVAGAVSRATSARGKGRRAGNVRR